MAEFDNEMTEAEENWQDYAEQDREQEAKLQQAIDEQDGQPPERE